MPSSQLVSAQHGIIAWSKNADGDAARLVVQTGILVRRSMEPRGPWGGQRYWAAYSYTWGPSYYYTK